MFKNTFLLCAVLLAAAGAVPAQQTGRIVEEIVARVNSEIITRSDYERARGMLEAEVRRGCSACTEAQIRQQLSEQERNLLRDLIDSSLLAQKGKDLGINVETDVVRRLDEIRQSNGLESLEELEQRVAESGIGYEDFKNTIRNQFLTQEVIRREVGSRIIMDQAEIQKYYDEHKDEFVRPEQVVLREIFVSTAGKPESEKEALRQKAEGLLARVRGGEDFGELAKRFSDGSTAAQGGELGVFGRGQLAPELEAAVFQLDRNGITDVLSTPSGFLILQVGEHYREGLQPREKVEWEIMNALYDQKIRPAVRDYLNALREESFIEVKPGYTDTAQAAESDPPAAPAPAADPAEGRRDIAAGRD